MIPKPKEILSQKKEVPDIVVKADEEEDEKEESEEDKDQEEEDKDEAESDEFYDNDIIKYVIQCVVFDLIVQKVFSLH